jgi:hypothetical protein
MKLGNRFKATVYYKAVKSIKEYPKVRFSLNCVFWTGF